MPSPNSKGAYTYTHRGWTLPTLGFVLELHEEVLGASGGMAGVRDEGAILSAVRAPVESVGGDDAYPRLVDKVADLGHRLAKNHGFADGNKRTTLLVMDFALRWNGCYLSEWDDRSAVLVMSLLGAGHLDWHGLRHTLILGCGLDPSDVNVP